MTTKTTTGLQRRAKGIHPKKALVQQNIREKGCTLPEYLEAHEVQAVLAAAPHAPARLLMLLQWRAGLRVSEAVALEASDLSLEADHPTIRVRMGKGHRSRIVPVHPEFQNALVAVFQFVEVGRNPIIGVDRSTAWRWVQEAVASANEKALKARG